MRTVPLACVAWLMTAFAFAQVPPPPQQPAPPPPPSPGAPTAGALSSPGPPVATRAFTGKAGMIFQSVRSDRVADFEAVIGFLQAAMQKSTDPQVRAQAQGWRIFKAAEPVPNGMVLYVFVMDPAVPGADYGFGRILADAYPDRIQEIWKLYQGSLTGGSSSLLNLTPVAVDPATAP